MITQNKDLISLLEKCSYKPELWTEFDIENACFAQCKLCSIIEPSLFSICFQDKFLYTKEYFIEEDVFETNISIQLKFLKRMDMFQRLIEVFANTIIYKTITYNLYRDAIIYPNRNAYKEDKFELIFKGIFAKNGQVSN